MEELKYHYQYPHPCVTTDCVIFGFDGTKLNVLLIERGIDPFKGRWAFPGGFLKMDETALQGAKRELYEETGLKDAYIHQFHAFSGVDRDPRERVITIAYFALVRLSEVKDHDLILREATNELRRQIHFEPIGFELLPEKFTMTQLQHLYEAILSVKFDRRNFCNKMLKLGILTQLDETLPMPNKKVAFLYKFNPESYNEMKEKGFRLEF